MTTVVDLHLPESHSPLPAIEGDVQPLSQLRTLICARKRGIIFHIGGTLYKDVEEYDTHKESSSLWQPG